MLAVTIVSRRRLPEPEIPAMLALQRRYFDNVVEESFRRDLGEKDWVILLQEADGTLAGFSTQQLIEITDAGRIGRFLFSGDTVVAREHWRQPGLAGGFGHLMLRLIERHGEGGLSWFLISKGFRTYRFLPAFFKSYYPGPDRTGEERALLKPPLDRVAAHKFADAYDAGTGIISFRHAKDRLREEQGGAPEVRRRDAHVAFFARANPGWRTGDELACLAPIARANLKAAALRVIRATTPRWVR